MVHHRTLSSEGCSRRSNASGPKVSSSLPISALIIMLMAAASLTLVLQPLQGTDAKGPATRAIVPYTASIDGEGADGDICLAGCREYRADLSFDGVHLSNISSFWMDLEEVSSISGNTLHKLLSYDHVNSTWQQVSLGGKVDVRGFTVQQEPAGPLNVTVRLFFHLSWDLETTVKLIPRMMLNGTSVQLDTVHQVSMVIWGDLDMTDPVMTYHNGSIIEDRSTLRSGTTVTLSGLKFSYSHPTEPLSQFSPLPTEMVVFVNDSVSEVFATFSPGGYRAELSVPRTGLDKVYFTLRLEGIRSDWLFRVRAWRFEALIDDLSPLITLKRPSTEVKVSDEQFQFEVQFQDLPANSPVPVNGSSLQFRVKRGKEWSVWTSLPPQADARTISCTGTAVGMRGAGNTSLQFRAEDALGNTNISAVFPVNVNTPPVLRVPDSYRDSIWLSNRSLSLDGKVFAEDPDNDPLSYKWYIIDMDDNPLSMNRIFNRSLFNIDEGRHTVKLVVNDGSAERAVLFNITVKKVAGEDRGKTLLDLLKGEGAIYIIIPLAIIIAVLLVVPAIIMIHKKTREETDFVVEEGNYMSHTQADEMARKLRELYETSTTFTSDGENAAEVDLSSDFDFDYNLYEVLGLDKNATPQEIKRKYRDMAAFYHPDRVAQHKEITLESAVEEMIRINKAKEILLNPEARAKYDASIADMDFSIDINEASEGEDWG